MLIVKRCPTKLQIISHSLFEAESIDIVLLFGIQADCFSHSDPTECFHTAVFSWFDHRVLVSSRLHFLHRQSKRDHRLHFKPDYTESQYHFIRLRAMRGFREATNLQFTAALWLRIQDA